MYLPFQRGPKSQVPTTGHVSAHLLRPHCFLHDVFLATTSVQHGRGSPFKGWVSTTVVFLNTLINAMQHWPGRIQYS